MSQPATNDMLGNLHRAHNLFPDVHSDFFQGTKFLFYDGIKIIISCKKNRYQEFLISNSNAQDYFFVEIIIVFLRNETDI
jgi:hypothetical protein